MQGVDGSVMSQWRRGFNSQAAASERAELAELELAEDNKLAIAQSEDKVARWRLGFSCGDQSSSSSNVASFGSGLDIASVLDDEKSLLEAEKSISHWEEQVRQAVESELQEQAAATVPRHQVHFSRH